MGKESNIYIDLWRRYKTPIVSLMVKAEVSPQSYTLTRHEFEDMGDRKHAGYSFRLEIRNGVALNNIGGSAVARDLLLVLKESKKANELWSDKTYVFQNDKNFKLNIFSLDT